METNEIEEGSEVSCQVKIRPLMDGNSNAYSLVGNITITVKIRPLMDGNVMRPKPYLEESSVKIRPLMDGNNNKFDM